MKKPKDYPARVLAVSVQTLSCYTCAAGTPYTTCMTSENCAADIPSCFSAYTITGSTITVKKGCTPTCVPDPQTFCCTTNNCNVVQLPCYTCLKTSDESTCTITICGFSEIVCKNTFEKTGTGPTATYSVSKTCATRATCINQQDAFPLLLCCGQARCNVIFICFTCDETTDESSCTPTFCEKGTFCKSDYKLNGAVPVVTKSCAADCKAVDNTADKNVRTTCCKTGFCNENALSCNTCTNEADEPKCAATACAAADTRCQSTYTLTAPDVPVSKACAEACTPSATVKCCGTSQCNGNANVIVNYTMAVTEAAH
ncbi:extracellular matrix protein A-like [Acipenser ruthenus]|uniref:extracellular matrix protein A-like n=1 Tax=Acipenser ruthenus TaxID=7906 RepID=UPI0027424703|nr:extracellular matrix protein A-like [Acipenser ruthenus]